MLPTQILAVHCFELLMEFVYRCNMHMQILANIVRHALLLIEKKKKSVTPKICHTCKTCIASFMLCAEVLTKGFNTVHAVMEQPCWL